MEIVKVVYTLEVEKFFRRNPHGDSQEFKASIYDYIAEQISKCQLGHKIETKIVSQIKET